MCPPDTPDDAHDDEHTDVGIQEAHVEGITPTSAPRQFTGVKNDQEIRACPLPDEVNDERSSHDAETDQTVYSAGSPKVTAAESHEGDVADAGGE